jgi:hypothetical protein
MDLGLIVYALSDGMVATIISGDCTLLPAYVSHVLDNRDADSGIIV